MKLVVATQNKRKLQEIVDILADLNYNVISLADFPRVPRIVENGATFQANAIKKAVTVARFCKQLTLGEDSGLCVEALGGRPGVYSARFSGKDKNDEKNNRKVLRLLADLPINKRKAYYACAVAIADKSGLLGVVEGRCSGYIGFEPKGNTGFGYDPIFVAPGYKKTFAQLGPRIKHSMSHRFRALKKARKILEKYIVQNH
ncbi:MAG TPA: RdgB/HAM1 family non-canonical purine NTP pyrophosphatase [Candidatus Omnitrophota bacterium]|nr:RdgB/HAM1 family non-canonical purine NTP pyrophosphatase [Candidatus Omnitrophota bacterium]